MHSSIASVANLYVIHNDLLQRTIEGITDENEFTRPVGKGNSVNWIVGHIVNTRFFVNQLMGADARCEWEELYNGGVPIQDSSVYPSLTQLLSAWEKVSADLITSIGELSEEDLTAENTIGVPSKENNLRGVLTFFATHESVHIGQLAYIRRLLDLEQAFG